MLPYSEFMRKHHRTEIDHFIVHLLAVISTQPNNAHKTPEQIYMEQASLAGLTISTQENNAAFGTSAINPEANQNQVRNEEPPLSPESGQVEGLDLKGSIDVRDNQIDQEVNTDKIRDDRQDRDPVYKDVDKLEADHTKGITHSEKKDESKPKDKDNFTAHDKNPHSGGKEPVEKERAAESEKDPHYKKTEEIKKEGKK